MRISESIAKIWTTHLKTNHSRLSVSLHYEFLGRGLWTYNRHAMGQLRTFEDHLNPLHVFVRTTRSKLTTPKQKEKCIQEVSNTCQTGLFEMGAFLVTFTFAIDYQEGKSSLLLAADWRRPFSLPYPICTLVQMTGGVKQSRQNRSKRSLEGTPRAPPSFQHSFERGIIALGAWHQPCCVVN